MNARELITLQDLKGKNAGKKGYERYMDSSSGWAMTNRTFLFCKDPADTFRNSY